MVIMGSVVELLFQVGQLRRTFLYACWAAVRMCVSDMLGPAFERCWTDTLAKFLLRRAVGMCVELCLVVGAWGSCRWLDGERQLLALSLLTTDDMRSCDSYAWPCARPNAEL